VKRLLVVAATTLFVAAALALPGYTGYSGAPGTAGTCAGTCHGSGTGTIQTVGFPTAYEPGQSYVIRVFKQSGSSISNFNASVRVGDGTQTAGTITAGYVTATYSTGSEPNGVHLSSNSQDSCTFNWQAPDPAVGDVKLYVAGHQGNQGGANTVTVLTSSPMTGVNEGTRRPLGMTFELRPSVAAGPVGIRLSAPTGSHPSLRVVDRVGRVVARIGAPESEQLVVWRPLDRDGRRLAAGTYLVILQVEGERLVRKLVLK
jgi:hypothetical protein